MKIVFISLDNFPFDGPCSSLLKKLLGSGLASNFNEKYFIAISKSVSPSISKFGTIQVIRVVDWDQISFSFIKKEFMHFPLNSICGIYHKIILRIKKQKKDDLSIINYSLSNQVYRALTNLNLTSEDIIIPVAGNYSTVYAAMRAKEQFSSKMLVYQVDPCSTNQVYSEETYGNRFDFEKCMYNAADAVITTPIIYKEMSTALSEEQMKKTYSMEFPNVAPSHQGGSIEKSNNDRRINCIYAGRVYKGARNPSLTLRLFNALEDKRIIFMLVGVDDVQARGYIGNTPLSDNIEFRNILPLEQTQSLMEKADILVNIGNIVTNQVPSKIFEYISMGKPIVNVCVNHECPTLPYLKNYPYVLNIFEDDSDFENQLQSLHTFILENSGKRVSPEFIYKEYETCTAQYCAAKMNNIIETIV